MKTLANTLSQLDRRNFITRAAQTFLGVGAMPLIGRMANAKEATSAGAAKQVIYLYMGGGMSHWIPST